MASRPRSTFGRPLAGRRRKALAAALLVSAAGHALLARVLLPRIGNVEVVATPAEPMTVVLVPRESLAPMAMAETRPPTRPVASLRENGERVASHRENGERVASLRENGEEDTRPSTRPVPSLRENGEGNGEETDLAVALFERREETLREALSPTGERLVPWRGASGTPGGPRSPTDSIDGRARLGSGEPGDPRIPGSGNVDIVAVVERDGLVAQAQERARQGQVHPFLGAVKDRVETCWLPVVADAESVTRYVAVEDGVCAKGFHLRRNVGRVFAIYDPKGARIAIELDTGHDGAAATLLRRMTERVRAAFDEAGMRDVPPELLDEEGLLRVAWNVYIDDYRGCGLQGRGANAHKPGGDEIIGIVELDGLY